nr:hypothetical protein [Photorhabdus khanii]
MATSQRRSLLLSVRIIRALPVSGVTAMEAAPLLILASQVVRWPKRAIGLPLANTVFAPSAITSGPGWSLHTISSP